MARPEIGGPARDGGMSLVFAVVLIGASTAILDVAVVDVAIPSIRSDLHARSGVVELVTFAYTVVYACLLVTGGHLGDVYGEPAVNKYRPLNPPSARCPCCGLVSAHAGTLFAKAWEGGIHVASDRNGRVARCSGRNAAS